MVIDRQKFVTKNKKVKIVSFNNTNRQSVEGELAKLLSDGWQIASSGAVPIEVTVPLVDRACPYEHSYAYGMPSHNKPIPPAQVAGFVILKKSAD
jgi:hypothetical protein